MTQSGHARSIGASEGAALLRAALATDLVTALARSGRLRFVDAADGVLQMRRPIGQRGLDRQTVDAGAEQRLPEIALEAILQEICNGPAHIAIEFRLFDDNSCRTAIKLRRPSRRHRSAGADDSVGI